MSVTNGQPRGNSAGVGEILYPVRAEVEYRLKQGRRIVEVGRTQTASLSGRQVVLDSRQKLAPGMEIELIMAWPGLRGALSRLLLRVHGRTVASRGPGTKVQIGRYSFETQQAAQAKPVKSLGATLLSHEAPFAS